MLGLRRAGSGLPAVTVLYPELWRSQTEQSEDRDSERWSFPDTLLPPTTTHHAYQGWGYKHRMLRQAEELEGGDGKEARR